VINVEKSRGFTLTELMFTVAIVIILAALAIPNYRGHVLRTNRTDATAALMRIAAEQEKFYLQNNTYTNDLGAAGLNVGGASASKNYALAVANADLQGYDATATAKGSQANDSTCAVFALDEQGQRTAEADDHSDTSDLCWRN